MKQNHELQASSPPKFCVGDHVRFEFPGRMVEAVVIEDRGPIGWKGRRLLRVKVIEENDSTVGHELEMPEDELAPA